MFDVAFMTFDEEEREKNWAHLKERKPNAINVHGVKGIARAWVEAAHRVKTTHYFTMDGDSRLNDGFTWAVPNHEGENDLRIHVYRARNGVNGLVYGYGSIHLFPTQLVRDFKDLDVVDFTLSVAAHGFVIQPEVASTTYFNTSPYHAWRSGFREASKLASKTNSYIGTNPDPRSMNRLQVWMSIGRDAPHGDHCILGARMGAFHGAKYKTEPAMLAKISDYNWFMNEFEKIRSENPWDMSIFYQRELEKYDLLAFNMDWKQSAWFKQIMYSL